MLFLKNRLGTGELSLKIRESMKKSSVVPESISIFQKNGNGIGIFFDLGLSLRRNVVKFLNNKLPLILKNFYLRKGWKEKEVIFEKNTLIFSKGNSHLVVTFGFNPQVRSLLILLELEN